ncbi:DUF732 domain-containing protein [Arthrobacter sp. UYCo732]|uniref:DUF732 domain-containing protein n=1 Tax=Arthrobacter sp. UYCo732 TaxID=3156336 RepID=UPI0033959D8F
MKKLASLSLAAAILAMTAGCSMLPQAGPAPTVTVTAGSSPSATAEPTSDAKSTDSETGVDYKAGSPKKDASTVLTKTMWDYEHGTISDTAFVTHVRANTTTLDPYDESMLVVLTQTTCAAVYNGTTKAEIVEKQASMAESKQGAVLTREMGRDIGYLLGAGSKNYCPELSDELVSILS